MNPFLLPLRQKTTVEVDNFTFSGGQLDSNISRHLARLRLRVFSKSEYSSRK
jgi:K+-transporting ATPase c subunit